MRALGRYFRELWAHAKLILTGSGLAVAVLLYEHFAAKSIPQWPFWILLLLSLVWAGFGAWRSEHDRARDLGRRAFAQAPQVIVEYDAPGIQDHAEELRVRKTSAVVAYNVQVSSFGHAGITVVLDLIPHIASAQTVVLPIRTAEDAALPLNRLHRILMRDRPQDLAAWAEPFEFTLSVSYTDTGGTRFASSTRFEFQPVTKTATVRQVGSVLLAAE